MRNHAPTQTNLHIRAHTHTHICTRARAHFSSTSAASVQVFSWSLHDEQSWQTWRETCLRAMFATKSVRSKTNPRKEQQTYRRNSTHIWSIDRWQCSKHTRLYYLPEPVTCCRLPMARGVSVCGAANDRIGISWDQRKRSSSSSDRTSDRSSKSDRNKNRNRVNSLIS